MKNIELALSIDETNLILEALGELPFARVYVLIGKIQERARAQLDEHAPPGRPNERAADERTANARAADGPPRQGAERAGA